MHCVLVVYRSQHEELDLVSVEEFYKQAPSHIVKSVSQNAGGGGGEGRGGEGLHSAAVK